MCIISLFKKKRIFSLKSNHRVVIFVVVFLFLSLFPVSLTIERDKENEKSSKKTTTRSFFLNEIPQSKPKEKMTFSIENVGRTRGSERSID